MRKEFWVKVKIVTENDAGMFEIGEWMQKRLRIRGLDPDETVMKEVIVDEVYIELSKEEAKMRRRRGY